MKAQLKNEIIRISPENDDEATAINSMMDRVSPKHSTIGIAFDPLDRWITGEKRSIILGGAIFIGNGVNQNTVNAISEFATSGKGK